VSKKENDYKNKFSAPKGEIHCMNCVHMLSPRGQRPEPLTASWPRLQRGKS